MPCSRLPFQCAESNGRQPGDPGVLRGVARCVAQKARTRNFASPTFVGFAFSTFVIWAELRDSMPHSSTAADRQVPIKADSASPMTAGNHPFAEWWRSKPTYRHGEKLLRNRLTAVTWSGHRSLGGFRPALSVRSCQTDSGEHEKPNTEQLGS